MEQVKEVLSRIGLGNMPQVSQQTLQSVISLKGQFHSAEEFLKATNPSMQVYMYRDEERAFMGKAPSLNLLSIAYGHDCPKAWLKIQLFELSEYSNVNMKMSEAQIDQTAVLILENKKYATWKVSEFMYFFFWFKQHGKFWGTVDGMVIIEALNRFCEVRAQEINRIEQKRREEEDRKWRESAITRQEYELLKQRQNG